MPTSIDDITIDEEFKSLHRELTEDERTALLTQVNQYGFRDPLVVWLGHNILLDGHNRMDLWETAFDRDPDKEPQIVEYAFKDRKAALKWADSNQRARRNLTREELSYRRGAEYQEQKKQGQRTDLTSHQNDEKSPAAISVGKKHGVAPATVGRDSAYKDALDSIGQNVGDDVKQSILSSSKKIPKSKIIAIGKLPADEQKAAFSPDASKVSERKTPEKKSDKPTVTKCVNDSLDLVGLLFHKKATEAGGQGERFLACSRKLDALRAEWNEWLKNGGK